MGALLDLSDIRIAIGGLTPTIQAAPGYAYLPENAEPIIGQDAVSVARLHPTRINNRYWSELNTEPASPSHGKVRHHADLVWYHLKQLKEYVGVDESTLLIPSSYNQQQLKLLAGICQSLDINLRAFANRAVSVGLSYTDYPEAVHVELQQHQTVLSFLERDNNRLHMTSSEKLPALGLVRLQERWLHTLRQRFISSSRFDPMYSGDTEQQLFSQLQEQISDVSGHPFEFKVTHEQQQLIEHFSEEELALPFQDLLVEIKSKVKGLPLILDSFFEGIPGVKAMPDLVVARLDAPFLGAPIMCRNSPDQREEVAHFVHAEIEDNSSPHNLAPELERNDSAKVSGGDTSLATHILLDGYAHPADNYDIQLVESRLQLQSAAPTSNAHISYLGGQLQLGEKASELTVNYEAGKVGMPLNPGDQIVLAGQTNSLTAIAVGTAGSG